MEFFFLFFKYSLQGYYQFLPLPPLHLSFTILAFSAKLVTGSGTTILSTRFYPEILKATTLAMAACKNLMTCDWPLNKENILKKKFLMGIRSSVNRRYRTTATRGLSLITFVRSYSSRNKHSGKFRHVYYRQSIYGISVTK